MEKREFSPFLVLHRCLKVMARTPKLFRCIPLRRNQECNHERRGGKQDEARYLRNIHGEKVMLPGKRTARGHQVIMKGQESERDRQQSRATPANPRSENDCTEHRGC